MGKVAKFAKPILKSLIFSGAVVIAFSSPSGSRRLIKMIGRELRQKRERDQFLWSLGYLRRKEYITYKEKNGIIRIELTENGKQQALIYNLDLLTLPKESIWDKKWRVIAFDIPERLRKGRDALRMKLEELGAVQLQKSLWVWPYECRKEVDFIAEVFNIGKFVHYLTVESLTSEDFLVQKFFSNQ